MMLRNFLRLFGSIGAALFGLWGFGHYSAIAAYDVTISAAATHNESNSNGVWSPTGPGAVVNVNDLESSLSSGSASVVTGSSGSQAGNILIGASISPSLTWSANTLTLDAYGSIIINAPVVATMSAGLSLITNDGGTGNPLTFNKPVSFQFTTESLTIGSPTLQNYTLFTTLSALAQDVHTNPSGFYALASGISNAGIWHHTPIPTAVSGIVEGLGNTISGLTISDTTVNEAVGLFSTVNSSGSINDLGLNSASITGISGTASVKGVAGFVVTNQGTLFNDWTSGSVEEKCASTGCDTGGNFSYLGALAAHNTGDIFNCYSSATTVTTDVASTDIGGLVGYNDSGLISLSYATGNVGIGSDLMNVVSGNNIGGLVGYNHGGSLTFTPTLPAAGVGSATNDYATGSVTDGGANMGGLIGLNDNASALSVVSNSYASGALQADTASGTFAGGLIGENKGEIELSNATGNVTVQKGGGYAGGLVGENDVQSLLSGSGSITYSYATGNVTNDGGGTGGLVGRNYGTISQSFANGTVGANDPTDNGLWIGGFVGYNSAGGVIDNSYAAGTTVNGTTVTGGQALYVGGFAGGNGLMSSTATIRHTYFVGTMSGGTQCSGAFLGNEYDTASGQLVDSYWDSTTQHGSPPGVGCNPPSTGVSPITTSQLQSGLPGNFNPSIWGQSSSINNNFPYLLNNPPP
jgi:hypothetical protein